MSEPTTDPTPVTDPAPESQAPAAAAPEPPNADPEPAKAPSNPWEDPAAAKAEIERLRRENASRRTAKASAAEEARNELAQTIGKALGLVADEPVDPAKLTEQLTQAQSQARQHALELAIFRATPDASVANQLLDSRTFLAKVADLDPTDGVAIAAAVGEAVANNPALAKRAPAPNPAQGSSAGGPGSAGQLSRQDVERLAREGKTAEINKAREDGRLDQLLGIQTT